DAFFVVTKPPDAKKRALDYIDLALARVEEMDAIFPHSADLATFFIQSYDLLAENVGRPELKQRYTLELLKWAQEGVRRSPWQSLFHEWLAKAYWLRGNIEAATARKPFYEKGIEEYEAATECYPISTTSWRKYGDALVHFGDALKNSSGDTKDEADIAKGHEMIKKAEDLEKAIAALR
ncbi:MAG: hypothetical protein NTU83_01955, partial [Candidatus Hydrogenedentes bacterium]|nr:hypothetical protein [Candidatus Hydrogenedentota bacterium]